MFSYIFVILAVLAIFGLSIAAIVAKLLRICEPNEALVISGSGPGKRNYRVIQGGRTLVLPLLEKVDRLDLTNMVIDIRVLGAYSKGGIPLNVEGVANVKVGSAHPVIGNAIERLLGVSQERIKRVARETLEGNLRGVLSTLTPEEVNQDRVKFAQSLLDEADADLRSLGIVLDNLKIQNVGDDRGYLDSIGRKQSAELIMTSRVAEAENTALAAVRNAENLRDKESKRIEAEIAKANAEAERALVDAQTQRAAKIAEEKATVFAKVAKAEAEIPVQRAQIEQVRFQMEADVVKPAAAKRQQMIAEARAEAASVLAEGRATAKAMRSMAETWREGGVHARRALIAQKFHGLVNTMLSTTPKTSIEKITMVGSELGGAGSKLGAQTTVLNELLSGGIGSDLSKLLAAKKAAG